MKIHACWLSRRCRAVGGPAYTYLHFKEGHLLLAPAGWLRLRTYWIDRDSDTDDAWGQ